MSRYNRKIIMICGIPHLVAEKDDVFNSDNTHFGQIDFEKCTITINANMTDEEQEETLCHEILHGILVHLGYDELSQDEKFVQAVANSINQTFEIKEQDHE